jgi:hypothetical protein
MRDFLQRIAVQLPTRCCRRRGGHIHRPAVAPSGALPALAGASNPNGSNVKASGSPPLGRAGARLIYPLRSYLHLT